MRRVRATIEFVLEDTFGITDEDRMYLENEVLVGDGNLILHSNDIGDTVGVVKSVKWIQYLPNKDDHSTVK